MTKKSETGTSKKAQYHRWSKTMLTVITVLLAAIAILAAANALVLPAARYPNGHYFLDTIIKGILAPITIGASIKFFHDVK